MSKKKSDTEDHSEESSEQSTDTSGAKNNTKKSKTLPKKSKNTEGSDVQDAKAASKKRDKVARNFIKTYGKASFRAMLIKLAEGESGQAIADEYEVSRERVRQWKNTFGDMVLVYRLHPEIEKILRERREE